nr:MAG TPA: hypothetical protein [Caudoviricetes sp.]
MRSKSPFVNGSFFNSSSVNLAITHLQYFVKKSLGSWQNLSDESYKNCIDYFPMVSRNCLGSLNIDLF